mgnify:CR=1 FL=1
MYKKIRLNILLKIQKIFSSKKNDIHPIEKKINYIFKNQDYLIQAFTHKSIDKGPRNNYERLEFLGDSVLDLIISKALLKEFPEGDEGLLTERRAALVQKSYLAKIGKLLNLMKNLKINHNVDLKIDKIADKQLANLFESLLGAIFLDGGIKPCENLILNTVWPHRNIAWEKTNYKGKLIEYCHSKDIENPIFELKDIYGPDHQRIFEIQVKIGSKVFKSGTGTNKKTAEQIAAQIALEDLKVAF